MFPILRSSGRFFYCLIIPILWVAAARAGNAPAMTTVQDILYRADGTIASGTLLISWPGFTTADNKPVAAGSLSQRVDGSGQVTLALAPNAGATPSGTYYKVFIKLDDGTSSTEYWVIPAASGSPVTIGSVRTAVAPGSGLAALAAEFVRKHGDTMTGPLTASQFCLGTSCLASWPGAVFDVRAYGAKCDGSTDDSTAIGNAVSAAAAVNGTVSFPAATCIGTITLPDNGSCVNLKGAGKAASVIQAPTGTSAAAVLYKGANSVPTNCSVHDLTFDAKAQTAYGCQLLLGKGWTLQDVTCQNATTEDWALGDVLGQGRASYNISSISRSAYVTTVTLASTPSPALIAGELLQIAGVSDSSYNVAGKIATVVNATTFTYANTGSDGFSSGGTATMSSTGAGFYEVKASNLNADSTLASFTSSNRPANCFHLYASATDSDYYNLIARNCQTNGIRNDGGAIRVWGAHAYGYSSTGVWDPAYAAEDNGSSNSYYGLEADQPQLAAIHIMSKNTTLLGGQLIMDYSNYPLAQIAVIDTTASSYTLDKMQCTAGGPNGNLFTVGGVSGGYGFPNGGHSFLGTFPGCLNYMTTVYPVGYYLFGTSDNAYGVYDGQLQPLFDIYDARAASDNHPILQIESSLLVTGDFIKAARGGGSLFRVKNDGSVFTGASVNAISGFQVNGSPLAFSHLAGTASASQLPGSAVQMNQANSYTAGMKQTFSSSSATAGVGHTCALTADPSTLSNGDMWCRGDLWRWSMYMNGATQRFAFLSDLPAAQVNSDWNAASGVAQILNKPTVPAASSTTPSMDGTATTGASANYARADHVHPADTSRAKVQSCTNKVLSAVDSAASSGNCVPVSSAMTDTSLAVTGADINTAGQVTSTHLGTALPVAQGGTGATTSTGSGSVVLATSPALTTPSLTQPKIGGNTISNVPVMTWSPYVYSTVGTSAQYNWTPVYAITVKRFQVFLNQAPSGCTTAGTYALYDSTASSIVASVNFANGTYTPYDSGVISANVPAGDLLTLKLTTATAGCTTQPGYAMVTAQFQMQ